MRPSPPGSGCRYAISGNPVFLYEQEASTQSVSLHAKQVAPPQVAEASTQSVPLRAKQLAARAGKPAFLTGHSGTTALPHPKKRPMACLEMLNRLKTNDLHCVSRV